MAIFSTPAVSCPSPQSEKPSKAKTCRKLLIVGSGVTPGGQKRLTHGGKTQGTPG
jgi:hypothetical protein